jgi:hypothetical protein
MTTQTETAPRAKSRRIRRAPVQIDASTAPRLRECLASGLFLGIETEKKDGTRVKYSGHKLFARHWTAKPAAELTTRKARSEAQKAQTVFSAVNLGEDKKGDGIVSISGDSRVFRITHNGKTWTLGQSEYELQRAEFAAQERAARNAELAGIVTTALAETLESGDFPADFCAIL